MSGRDGIYSILTPLSAFLSVRAVNVLVKLMRRRTVGVQRSNYSTSLDCAGLLATNFSYAHAFAGILLASCVSTTFSAGRVVLFSSSAV